MNWIDIGILGAVVVPGVIGLKTGIIRVMFTLAGIGLGVFLAMQYYGTLAPIFRGFVSDDSIANAGGFAVILIGIILVGWLISSFVKKVLSFVLLGWVDNVAGGLLGVVLGGSIASVVLFLLSIMPGLQETIDSSAFAPFFANMIPNLLGSDVSSFLPL